MIAVSMAWREEGGRILFKDFIWAAFPARLSPDLIAQPHHITFELLCLHELERDRALCPLARSPIRGGRQVGGAKDAARRLSPYEAGIDEHAYLIYQPLAEEQAVQCAARIRPHPPLRHSESTAPPGPSSGPHDPRR